MLLNIFLFSALLNPASAQEEANLPDLDPMKTYEEIDQLSEEMGDTRDQIGQWLEEMEQPSAGPTVLEGEGVTVVNDQLRLKGQVDAVKVKSALESAVISGMCTPSAVTIVTFDVRPAGQFDAVQEAFTGGKQADSLTVACIRDMLQCLELPKSQNGNSYTVQITLPAR